MSLVPIMPINTAVPNSTQVLIVDDDPAIRMMLSMALNHHGIVCEVACNGIEAIEAVQRSVPSVMLLDLMMPDMNGFEVLDWLKENKCECSVVIISAHLKSSPQDLIRRGAHSCLPKPFDMNTLLSTVNTLMENRATLN